MAGIDHTIIAFHNGMLMENTAFYKFNTNPELDEVKEFLPFTTNRDGFIRMEDENFDLVLPNYGVYQKPLHLPKNKRYWIKVFLWNLENKKFKKQFEKNPLNPPENYKIRYYYKTIGSEDEQEYKQIFVYTNEDEEYNITFYFDYKTNDSYVVLGGYGHHRNPYLHFYERGYGREFERKMATECYAWICDEIFKEILEGYTHYQYGFDYDYYEQRDEFNLFCQKLNHVYWLDQLDIPEEKRKSLIDLDPECTDEKKEEFRGE